MKKLLAFLLFVLACVQAHAVVTPTFICNCDDKGAVGGAHNLCVNGSDSYNGLSRYPGFLDDGVTANAAYGPKQTVAAIKTAFSGQNPTTAITRICRGGKWNNTLINNFRNTLATAANPTILEDYDAPWMPAGDSGSGGTVTYTLTTVCDSSKSWNTTDNGGLGRYAGMSVKVAINTERNEVTQHWKIGSNTATCLTLQSDPKAYSVNNLRFAIVPPAGNAYTIEGPEPELWSLANFNTASAFGLSPGTQSHAEGYTLRRVAFKGSVDGVDVASVNSSSGVVTVSTAPNNHNLTTGDLIAVVDVTCSGCTGGTHGLLTNGASITVTSATQFTYSCSVCANGTGSAVAGSSMYYRKVAGRLLSIGKDQDNITLDDVTIDGANVGLQADTSLGSNIYTLSGLTDGYGQWLTIINSRIMNGGSLPALITYPYTLIAKTLFYRNGTTIFDHHLYLGGAAQKVQPSTISTFVGNGSSALVVLTGTSNMVATERMVVTVTGATPSACNVTDAVVTYVSPTQFTYPVAAGCNTSVTGATISLRLNVLLVQVYIIRNSFVNAAMGAPGQCGGTAFVVHGARKVLVIVDNDVFEEVDSNTGTCWGISVADGGYPEPEAYEHFSQVIIDGNRVSGFPLPISVDMCTDCQVTNNYVQVSTLVTGGTGIRAPAKDQNYDAGTVGQSNKYVTPFRNNKVRINYNTVFFPTADANSKGIQNSKGQSLSYAGTHHEMVGNIVYFGAGWTTATACFSTDGANSGTTAGQPLEAANFDTFDNNLCFATGQGASKPKWNSGVMSGTARTTLALQQAVGLDTNSSATCDPWGGTPPTADSVNRFDLSIATGSCAKNAGHATVRPALGQFMRRRAAAGNTGWSAGAFEANSLATPRAALPTTTLTGTSP